MLDAFAVAALLTAGLLAWAKRWPDERRPSAASSTTRKEGVLFGALGTQGGSRSSGIVEPFPDVLESTWFWSAIEVQPDGGLPATGRIPGADSIHWDVAPLKSEVEHAVKDGDADKCNLAKTLRPHTDHDRPGKTITSAMGTTVHLSSNAEVRASHAMALCPCHTDRW